MTQLTPRAVAYCLTAEGIVPEAYLDTAKPPVWTWAGGITAEAGVDVLKYKDHPAPIAECLKATVERMQSRYLPAVTKAFAGHSLTEVQIAAALSFEWHYGAILAAQWVKDWCAGNPTAARADFMSWTDHGKALGRAKAERSMFFDGIWPTSLLVPVYQVRKPGYRPCNPVQTNVLPMLQQIMGGK